MTRLVQASEPSISRNSSGPIDVTGSQLVLSPFRHFTIRRCINDVTASALLDWFETEAPWHLVKTNFYEQYEFSLFDAELPSYAGLLIEPRGVAHARSQMAVLFGVEFEQRVNVVAHKLSPGQRIAIHNDYLAGEETHRLVVQLNRGLDDDAGGMFILFNSADPSDIHQVLRPLHLSGLGFEISARSFHAVSRMHAGDRYTLVFSFYTTAAARRALGSH
jgi:hypothetical protein